MKRYASAWVLLAGLALPVAAAVAGPLGLPPVPVPADNPMTPQKVTLGSKLFNDKRFSSTGQVACANCHDPAKAFTDSPRQTSEGINKLTGTRNAPTVVNAAYFTTQFWDGRSPSLEDQSQHPFLNPVEMGLKDHQPILQIVRTDPAYVASFREVYGLEASAITMNHVQMAIAAFERTIVSGDSAFDRWYFGGDKAAMSDAAVRGFTVFLQDGRCVSCHVIEQDRALFTDNRFHNVGVGMNRIQAEVPVLAPRFLEAKAKGMDVDVVVLSNPSTSELGRFAITDGLDDLGAFKTPTLRNVAVTAPFMHDGSLKTLRDVVVHYNNGGVTSKGDKVNDFLSGGIRELNLSEEQISDLVAFLEALTSPQYAQAAATASNGSPPSCDVATPAPAATVAAAATAPTAGATP
ncbi:MAG: cytochrome c peroxidase [Steroidobacteraceae bacterium]